MGVRQVPRSVPPLLTTLVRAAGDGDVAMYNTAKIILRSRLTTADVQPQTLNPTADGTAPQPRINRLARSTPTATGNDQLFSPLPDRLVLPALLLPQHRHVSIPAFAQYGQQHEQREQTEQPRTSLRTRWARVQSAAPTEGSFAKQEHFGRGVGRRDGWD